VLCHEVRQAAQLQSRGGTEPLSKHDAIRQARLARILRYGDYNPKTKEVKLWKP